MSSKLLYELREVSFWMHGEESYTVEVDGEPELRQEFSNPLIAWARFIDIVDIIVRRRIGNMLKKQGRNRYTGELLNGEK